MKSVRQADVSWRHILTHHGRYKCPINRDFDIERARYFLRTGCQKRVLNLKCEGASSQLVCLLELDTRRLRFSGNDFIVGFHVAARDRRPLDAAGRRNS